MATTSRTGGAPDIDHRESLALRTARFNAAAGDRGHTRRPGSGSRHGRRHRRSVLVLAAIAAALVAFGAGVMALADTIGGPDPVEVYGDRLHPDYQNWSWARVDLGSTDEVRDGTSAIAVDFGPWEGLYLARPTPVDLAGGGSLEFWLHGGDGPPAPIHVVMVDGAHQGGPPVVVEPVPGTWTRYELPVAEFGITGSFGGLWWQNGSAEARQTIHLDDIRLVGIDQAGPTTDGPALTVDLGDRTISRRLTDPGSGQVTNQVLSFPHRISDGVYGLNFAAPSLLGDVAPGINRWGGNAVERYNHRTGTTNLGKDWYFMNNPGSPGDADRFEAANAKAGAETLLTMPATGWVAGQPARCGYPLPDYDPMDDAQPHFLDGSLLCGNGQRGGQAVPGRPETTSVASGPEDTRAWVSALVEANGSAADGGIEHYAVGNEPGLWHLTHADVVTSPMTRSAIIDTTLAHAGAIKDADPTAAVAGPVLWGGYSYYVTAAEFEAGQRPGDVQTFVADYLSAMAAAEAAGGRRLLDTLAVNFYDDRVYGGGTDELRLASTRSLWDPSYAPPDWWVVRDFVGEGSAVIPRLRSLIDATYPGTELAITEYNFGGLDTRAGGLAQADALGIFGREGLDRAMLWDPFNAELSPPEASFVDTPAMWAFRMYRNYDGAGAQFGDQALFAESADQDVLSVYAARRSVDDAITVMVINKASGDRTSTLTVPTDGTAEVHNWGHADLTSIRRLDDLTVDGGVTATFPARSMTLLVVHPEGTPGVVSVTTEAPTTTTGAPTTIPTTTVAPSTTSTATSNPTSTPTSDSAPTSTPTSTPGSSTTAPTTPTTMAPITAVPTTNGPGGEAPAGDEPNGSGRGEAFTENFADAGAMDRFDTGIYHRDDWVVTETSWLGDHAVAGPDDACTAPEERRLIQRGDRANGFNDDWIYRCRPGGDAAKAHLMTSIGDTSGYSIGAFTPTTTFRDVREVRWSVNITDLGGRQFTEVKVIPAGRFDFQNLPCTIEWLPCDTGGHGELGSVGVSFFDGAASIGAAGDRTTGLSWDAPWADTANDPARSSIRMRRQHVFRDNGDGTLSFEIERADGTFQRFDAPGAFPDGPVRVVFADHNYTPRKGEPDDITFTWHWDDLSIRTGG
ncbi:MAG: glycoside hydrolase family 44 protein [Actinomycetota bacterium]